MRAGERPAADSPMKISLSRLLLRVMPTYDDPKHWYDRAAEMRVLANDMLKQELIEVQFVDSDMLDLEHLSAQELAFIEQAKSEKPGKRKFSARELAAIEVAKYVDAIVAKQRRADDVERETLQVMMSAVLWPAITPSLLWQQLRPMPSDHCS
jgi:hypothetical protein